eukprot:6524233-Alexandrium_andersonii.AAC.1
MASGLHESIIVAYITHLESLRAVAFYATGCGKEATRQLSLPQGCPWSMAALSLLMCVWIDLVAAFCPDVR